MSTADDGIDQLFTGEVLGMTQGIDDAPVGTPQDDHQTAIGINDKCQVIRQRVGLKFITIPDKEVTINRFITGGHQDEYVGFMTWAKYR